MQIDMLSVFTDRFAAVKRFYTEVLEFEVKAEIAGRYVEFAGQGVRFAVCNRQEMVDAVDAERFAHPATGRAFSLAFRAESRAELEQQYADLVARGAEPVRAPGVMPWGQLTAFFADPDGNVHELAFDLPK